MGVSLHASLVSMPFGMVFSPSIALGSLKVIAESCGWSASVHHCNVEFASWIGTGFYNDIAARLPTHSLIGEWVFSSCFQDSNDDDQDRFLECFVRPLFDGRADTLLITNYDYEQFRAELLEARALAPEFVRQCAESISGDHPNLVGVTSVFQQHVASVALAKELRQVCPSAVIVIGGANCEGVMGKALAEVATCFDVIVSGEGEEVFKSILSDVEEGSIKPKARALFVERQAITTREDLDALPIPDYSEYFDLVEHLQLEDSGLKAEIPFETARGCWWGEKHHCTFCGLNGQGMPFRSKSPERAYSELVTLLERYPGRRIAVTDNILDMKYLKTLLPRLATKDIKMQAFWEIKANLSREQIKIAKAAGVTHVQPGIESFSAQVLALMKKGVRPIQNVQLLVDCRAIGIVPGWNILWGFPGEKPDEYALMAELLPALYHLQPPVGAGPVGIHRFSPLFEASKQMSLGGKIPAPAYRHAFRFVDEKHIADIAYFFDSEFAVGEDVTAYSTPVKKAVSRWKTEHGRSLLVLVEKADGYVVVDTRSCRIDSVVVLREVYRDIVTQTLKATTREQLQLNLEKRYASDVVSLAIASLLERRILIELSGWLLCIAVPLSESYQPDGVAAAEFVSALTQSSERGRDEDTLVVRSPQLGVSMNDGGISVNISSAG